LIAMQTAAPEIIMNGIPAIELVGISKAFGPV
jgi:hypothetical protein